MFVYILRLFTLEGGSFIKEVFQSEHDAQVKRDELIAANNGKGGPDDDCDRYVITRHFMKIG